MYKDNYDLKINRAVDYDKRCVFFKRFYKLI
jgi:hypothetical protein